MASIDAIIAEHIAALRNEMNHSMDEMVKTFTARVCTSDNPVLHSEDLYKIK